MKIIKLITIVGLISLHGVVTAQTTDFRNLTWGMDLKRVKSLETCNITREIPSRIYYDCTIADIKGQIVYTFTTNDLLMRAKYFFTPDYSNANFYVRDFRMFQELLTSKYGQPFQKNVITVNKTTLTESEWSGNLLTGNLRLETVWRTDKTDILLTMSRFNDQIAIQIDYVSQEMSKVDVELKKKILTENL